MSFINRVMHLTCGQLAARPLRRQHRSGALLRVAACALCRRSPLLPLVAARSSPAVQAGSRGALCATDSEEAALDAYLDTLKWDDKGLLVAIAQASASRALRLTTVC